MQDPETRRGFLSKYRQVTVKNHPSETWVHQGVVMVVNHMMETLVGDRTDAGLSSEWAELC